MVWAELGSTKPQPVLPFWVEAASALQIPWPLALISAQQAERQSASETQPPVVNCWALPLPTSLAPALLGARARAETATVEGFVLVQLMILKRKKVKVRRAGHVLKMVLEEVGYSGSTYKPGQR